MPKTNGFRKMWMAIAATMLALSLVAAPAMAEVVAGSSVEEVESGDAEGTFEVSNGGDLSNQCAVGGNFANSGNAVSSAAVSQYQTETDDIEIEGSSIVFGGGIAGECTQSTVVG